MKPAIHKPDAGHFAARTVSTAEYYNFCVQVWNVCFLGV